jgi:hypothetical protein
MSGSLDIALPERRTSLPSAVSTSSTDTHVPSKADTTPSPTAASVITPSPAPDLTDVYRAYLEQLRSQQSQIDLYTWQKGYYEGKTPPEEKLTRSVVVCDVWGDEIPELIYVRGDPQDGASAAFMSSLHILTWENGELRRLFGENWDNEVAGGFRYVLYTVRGDKTLRSWTSTGDESWTKSHIAFVDGPGGVLIRERRASYYTGPGKGPDGYKNPVNKYECEGRETSKEEYERYVAGLLDDIDAVLMYSAYVDDDLLSVISASGCSAMTSSEAISWLREQIGE